MLNSVSSYSSRKGVFIGVWLIAFLRFTVIGCGSGSNSTPPPTQKVVITTQPASQTVPIGRTATFSVTSTGTSPLSYQWIKNGAEIAGATSAIYTTPLIAASDSGSTFQVKVSNASSSATSSSATLTAGPRAPAIGDLRYLLWQQVTVPWNTGGEPVNIGITEESIANALGTPLQLGSSAIASGGCEWHASATYLPSSMTGLNMYYQWDNTNDMPYASYLESVAAPNVVINSIDLEPTCDSIGVSWVQTTQSGGKEFDYKMESVQPSQLQSKVVADGAEGRIITAVTFDASSGNAILISYGWQGDTPTIYEAQTVITTPGNVASSATTLADEGYFISAFGGNDTDGYMLIGMRVQGDNLSRSVNPQTTSESVPFTPVVWLNELNSGAEIWEQ